MIRIVTIVAILLTTSLWGEDKFIIGIAGGSGSGKTTLARKLLEALGPQAVLIEQDSYYKDFSDLSAEKRAKQNFDHPDSLDFSLLRTHLLALKSNQPIEKPVYNFICHAREPACATVEPTKVIIVEGILLFAVPEIRDLLDLKLYVDADDDIRLLRRMERDISCRGRDFFSIKSQYMSTVKSMHLQFVEPSKKYADMVIPGDSDNSAAMGLIVSSLSSNIQNEL